MAAQPPLCFEDPAGFARRFIMRDNSLRLVIVFMLAFATQVFAQVCITRSITIYLREDIAFKPIGKLQPDGQTYLFYQNYIYKQYQAVDIVIDNGKQIITYKGYFIDVSDKEDSNMTKYEVANITGSGLRPPVIVKNPVRNPTWLQPFMESLVNPKTAQQQSWITPNVDILEKKTDSIQKGGIE